MKKIDVLLKIFPISLFIQITEFTSLKIFEKDTNKKRVERDYHEIKPVVGVSLKMGARIQQLLV